MTQSLSFWLGLAVLVIAATMMHPTLASLLAIGIISCLLILMRAAAHQEGAKALAGRLIDNPQRDAFKQS